MKFLSNIRRLDKKGITVVWLALFMFVLLIMFAGMAVDIGFMYVVKNDLQVAGDAAALAGAAKLGSTSDLTQTDARNEAILFAGKNKAGGRAVEIVTNNTNVLGNDNDITVGFWNAETQVYTPGATPINAVQVRPQRVSGLSGNRGPVSVFWGQIFRFIGANWSLMSARANAIAIIQLVPFGPFPLCNTICGTVTPLTTVTPNLTPGLRFCLKSQDCSPNIGWTSFFEKDTSMLNVPEYVLGTRPVPPICNTCIHTTQGLGTAACAVREKIRRDGADYVVNGVAIHGLKVVVPMLSETPVNCQAKGGCFTDPGVQPSDPYYVVNFAEIIVTDAIPEGTGTCSQPPYNDKGPFAAGDAGIVIVGTGPGAAGTSTISCLDCNDSSFENLINVKLVK